MSTRLLLFVLLTIFSLSLSAQESTYQFPSKQLERLSLSAMARIRNGDTAIYHQGKAGGMISGIRQLELYHNDRSIRNIRIPDAHKRYPTSDTLFVIDTLIITGNWIHEGTIVVAFNGILHFINANATILGDIYLFGEHPQLIADSSTLYIPQAYFYQRVVFAAGGSEVTYRNSTVDHSGLSHSILLVDSARLELNNATNKGFTTNGIYGQAKVFVNGTNEAGEYVIVDESALEFRNAHTVLLWHQFPEGSAVNFTFPEGDTTYGYHFNKTLPGVSGIEYEITVDSSYNVMWGIMPENGTDITISESEIRAIGLWFMGSDTVNVSGLLDNSEYTFFDAPLSDRNLRLINSKVKTWSIYPMEDSYVNLSDCIVGEIGTGGRSSLMGQQYFCDGSGGYVWASDSSVMINGFSFVSGYVRSQANGMLVYAYSSLASGYPSALQNSMLMVLQCTLPAEPVAYDNSVAWYAYIDKPFEANAGSIVPITGSAWIDKTESSNWMEFRSYHFFYQESASETWTEIPVDSLNEKRDEMIASWNTADLKAGQYLLKLVITDEWGNSAEAIKGIILHPTFGINKIHEEEVCLYPNPATELIYIELPERSSRASVYVYDVMGKLQMKKDISEEIQDGKAEISIKNLKPGFYLMGIITEKKRYTNKIIVK